MVVLKSRLPISERSPPNESIISCDDGVEFFVPILSIIIESNSASFRSVIFPNFILFDNSSFSVGIALFMLDFMLGIAQYIVSFTNITIFFERYDILFTFANHYTVKV